MSQQSSDTILMIRPASFGFNTETAGNNVFQQEDRTTSRQKIIDTARTEYDCVVMKLRDEGVKVINIADTSDPPKTDAVFSNNWISTHADGSLVLYPMYSKARRLERRDDLVQRLALDYDLEVDSSLLRHEPDQKYLESTGSMILDRDHKIIYACLSVRTHMDILEELGKKLGYEVVAFDALDEKGVPYYHTNVIMTLTQHIAIICTECIVNKAQRKLVIDRLRDSGKQIVDISRDQVLAYAGNMIEVRGSGSQPLLVMSKSAFQSLTKDQLHIIKNHNKIVYCDIPTIEKLGGGSVRCMITEIFLPKKT